uniref:Chemokine interleukin-8-like domain-containing protein n=1 Tax=Romanomermis culicivorax TaxID=13658 RepID=A0A915I500_ROMCU
MDTIKLKYTGSIMDEKESSVYTKCMTFALLYKKIVIMQKCMNISHMHAVKDWLITNTGKSTAQPDLVVEVQKHTGKCRCKLPDYSDFNFLTTVNHDRWTDENYMPPLHYITVSHA